MTSQSEMMLKLIDAIIDLAHDLEGEILTRHGLVCADQLSDRKVHPVTRMKAERELAFVEHARALVEPALAFVKKPFDCSACDDWPEPPNNPCAVCGKSR